MEFVSVKWLLLLGVLMLWIQMHGYKAAGCFEEERLALLQFKTSLGSDLEEHILPSWVDDPKSDCCDWERVTCNSTTGHVIELSLNNSKHNWPYYYCDKYNWTVNISMFQQIKELKSLDLSYNSIAGSFDKEDFGRLSGLKKLEMLNLSGNCFNSSSSIFSSLVAITSLKTLVFRYNLMRDSLPIQELSNLENLETLDLSDNYFNITQPIPDVRNLSKLSKLKYLDLSWNDFDDVIFNISSMFSSLQTLDLSNNRIEYRPLYSRELNKLDNLKELRLARGNRYGDDDNESTQPLLPQSLCGLKRIQHLDLSENNFGGSLPMCLSNLTYLTYLDLNSNSFGGSLPMCLSNLTNLKVLNLSSNQFSGKIESSLLASLISLNYINLSNNLFEGLFSFKSFSNHSSLEVVQFISDNDNFKIVTKYPNWIPPFQLRALVLQNCGLQGTPEFLFQQSSLKLIDLSHNKINESFPSWLLENNTGLELLFLKNNSLIGEIHLPTANVIAWLDVSDNDFGGQLQEIEGKIFPKMKVLDLSRNHFRGDFPFSPKEDCELMILDLSSNNFTGEISKELVSCCIFIEKLNLSHNNFQGQIFTSQFNLTRLSYLQLHNNQFVGTPSSLVTKLDDLNGLDISNNLFYGEIPSWIVNLTYMIYLSMQNNSFEGPISCELLSHLYVDLSHNSLSGLLPPCFNLQVEAMHINLQGNKFTGSIPEAFLNASSLLILNLRDNNLSGSILKRFGEFPNLQILSVAGNHLDGIIPNWLCQLNNISLLDLSNNYFFGFIPQCLCNLAFGSKELEIIYSYLYQGTYYPNGFFTEVGRLSNNYEIDFSIEQTLEFVTKYRGDTYKGNILNYISGLDLSHNDLTGEIPHEFGKLSHIYALNLSHNQLTGSIPRSFSNFSQIESLDVSYNNLSGEFPTELAEADLHFLQVFSVAHNNLSGRLPDMKGHFITFDNRSYEGNPFLCGPPLQDCNKDNTSAPLPIPPEVEDGKWYEIDEVVFMASFSVSFVIFFLGVITLLYVNLYWR